MPTKGLLAALALLMFVFASGSARGQSPEPPKPTCVPACPADQTCVNNVCMVPAAPATVAGTAAIPPATLPATVVAVPERRSAVALVPYLGVHSPVGKSGDDLDMGLHTGVLVGGRINSGVSLNGELSFDWFNPTHIPAGIDVTEMMFTLAFSPLVHAPLGIGEFVIGPSLGVFELQADLTRDSSVTGVSSHFSGTAHGWLVGGNAGLLSPIQS